MTSRTCLTLLLLAFPGAAFAQWSGPPQEGWAGKTFNAAPEAPPVQMEDPAGPAGRVGRLEEQLRTMRGELEQLQYQNRTLQEQLQKVQEDNEFRFQQIEGGGKKGAQPPRAQQRASAPPSTDSVRSPPQLGAPPRNLGQLPADESGNAVGAASTALEPLPGMQDDAPSAKRASITAGDGTPDEQYDLAYGYMLRGDYEMAEDSFRDFLAENPKHANAAKAEYWLGESQYQRKQYKAAAESFLKVYNNHPSSEKAPESLLRLGMSLKSLGQKDAACATFSEVGNKYPKSTSAVKKRVQTEQKNAGC